MRHLQLHRLLFACLLAAVVSPAVAQDNDPFDPTSPSPAIVEQEDAIRGLDRLKELESELLRIIKENEQLTNTLNEVKRRQALKDSVPTFRLVAMVQSDLASIAVVEAGGRAYRIRDNQQFTLELSAGEKVQVNCSIQSADTVEIEIPELSLTELVTFHPTDDIATTPRANRAVNRPRFDDDD